MNHRFQEHGARHGIDDKLYRPTPTAGAADPAYSDEEDDLDATWNFDSVRVGRSFAFVLLLLLWLLLLKVYLAKPDDRLFFQPYFRVSLQYNIIVSHQYKYSCSQQYKSK